jgi:hypothetical protein
MARVGDPVESLMAIDAVRALYVFDPDGKLVISRERGFQGTPEVLQRLARFVSQPTSSSHEVSEVVVFYRGAILFFRFLGERAVAVVANSQVTASLLRVTLEVLEHEWRAAGLQRVFPSPKGSGAGAGMLGKIFGKRRP